MSVLVFVHAAAAPSLVAPKVEWTSTARDGSTLHLLKDQSPLTMKAASEKPKGPALIVDRKKSSRSLLALAAHSPKQRRSTGASLMLPSSRKSLIFTLVLRRTVALATPWVVCR